MTPKEAKEILTVGLKGSKTKQLLVLATATKILKEYEQKSSKELGKELYVSKSIIDDFYNMNKHPPEIKKMIKKKKIGLDTSTKLFKIKDIKKRIEFARIIGGLSAMDARDIIDYHCRESALSAIDCKKIVFDSKTNIRKMHLIMTPLEDNQFRLLKKIATKKKMTVDQMTQSIMLHFLECEK